MVQNETIGALDHLNFDLDIYITAMSKAMKDNAIKSICEKSDIECRARLHPEPELTQSRQEVKDIYSELLKGESHIALNYEQTAMIQLEQTKLYDNLAIKHNGVKVVSLKAAVAKHNITKDGEIEALQQRLD